MESPPSTAASDDDAAALVDRLLGQLRAEAAPVVLNRGGVSLALQLDPVQQRWWIETPPAAAGHPDPVAGAPVGMSFSLDGVVVRCAAQFEGLDHVAGRDAWRLRYPRRIDYPQQRQAYRAVVVPPRSIAVRLAGDGGCHEGFLTDLSALGFGAQLPAAVTRGPAAQVLTIALDVPLQVSVEVLHHRGVDGDPSVCRVGGRFVERSPALQARIDQVVAMLQGRWLRTRVRR